LRNLPKGVILKLRISYKFWIEMTELMTKLFERISELPPVVQEEIAKQLIEDIDQEIKWQSSLENPDAVLDELGEKALKDSEKGKTKESGSDEL
jgi:hypothetical protein